jgi:hypothetical protein
MHLVIAFILIGTPFSFPHGKPDLVSDPPVADRILYFSMLPTGVLENSPSIGYILLGEVQYPFFSLSCYDANIAICAVAHIPIFVNIHTTRLLLVRTPPTSQWLAN